MGSNSIVLIVASISADAHVPQASSTKQVLVYTMHGVDCGIQRGKMNEALALLCIGLVSAKQLFVAQDGTGLLLLQIASQLFPALGIICMLHISLHHSPCTLRSCLTVLESLPRMIQRSAYKCARTDVHVRFQTLCTYVCVHCFVRCIKVLLLM